MCQRRIIIGTERIEIIRIRLAGKGNALTVCFEEVLRLFILQRLAGTVSAQQVVLKENTDFRNQRHIVFTGGGNLYRRNQVFLSIRTKHTDRKL